MSYKLYVDRNEDFTCEIAVKNASLKGSVARLIVESDDGPSLVFKGKLDGEKCVIPVKRLKGLLDENTRGKMSLEIIVEDTYFTPWKSDFIVEEHTSVKVKVDEQKSVSNKPLVKIKTNPILRSTNKKPIGIKKSVIKEGVDTSIPLKEISSICRKFGIKKNNLVTRKNDFFIILKEYISANPEYKNHKNTILSRIGKFLV